MYYILYDIYTTKKQFEVQIVGILEEKDSYIDKNAPLENVIWAGPSPLSSSGENPKYGSFSQETVP